MRLLILALVLAIPAWAQEVPAQKKKKPAPKTQQAVHKKPTPEQIRKFKQLEKKPASAPEPAKK